MEQILKQLDRSIELHKTMRKSFFWSPPGNASSRRWYEAQHSLNYSFEYDGVEYDISHDTTCSCRNIYYRLTVLVGGSHKDVRALKKVKKEIIESQDTIELKHLLVISA